MEGLGWVGCDCGPPCPLPCVGSAEFCPSGNLPTQRAEAQEHCQVCRPEGSSLPVWPSGGGGGFSDGLGC